ncbi:MAG: hypothetical protein M3Q44_00945 [bacterium]|nr:hypothetical protein [bacterium]
MEQNTVAPQTIITPDEDKLLLLNWKAPSRPFKKRDKDFFTTVTIMAILSIVILFFMREFLVIAVVIALVFLVYVLYTVPPEDIDNSIFTTGISNGTHFYAWPELICYWFETRWGNDILVAQTRASLPGSVYLLLRDAATRAKIEEVIGTRLIRKDVKDTSWMDRTTDWFTRKFPLEKNTQ